MPLEPDFEAAARKLCKARHINPDAMVNYVAASGHTNPAQRPAWRNAEEEIIAHHQRQEALQGSWVMKKEAGAPAPVVEEESYV